MTGFKDDDVLALMSAEERAALEEFTPEDEAAMARTAKTPNVDETDKAEGDDKADKAGEVAKTDEEIVAEVAKETAAAATKEVVGEGSAAADAAVVVETPAKRAEVAAPYTAPLPKDYEDQVKAIDTKLAETRQKYRDGEIEFDVYDTAMAECNAALRRLDSLALKAQIATEMTQQSAQQTWLNEIARAKTAAVKDGIDYDKDAAKRRDWDLFVRALGADPANKDQPAEWFLQTAHDRVKALHGIKPAVAEKTAEPTKEQKLAEAKDKRKSDVSKAPATLAHVAGGSAASDIGGDELSYLDDLNGADLEIEVARLQQTRPDQITKWLRQG